MARRKGDLEGLLDELGRVPWWVSLGVATVVYIGLAEILPTLAGGAFVDAISGLAVWIAAIFLIPAVRSVLHVWRGRRMLAANRTKEDIRSLDWEQFEELIEAHYRRLGFRVRREGGAGPDGGVDVRISKPGGETYLVQCKQWQTRRVGVKVVRELFGVVAAEDATGGIVVTAGTFTPEAVDFARPVAMELIDGDGLVAMMGDLPVRQADGADDSDDEAVEKTACPRCGSELVLRTARRGQNRGSQFYGCASYPRCRFTQPC